MSDYDWITNLMRAHAWVVVVELMMTAMFLFIHILLWHTPGIWRQEGHLSCVENSVRPCVRAWGRPRPPPLLIQAPQSWVGRTTKDKHTASAQFL